MSVLKKSVITKQREIDSLHQSVSIQVCKFIIMGGGLTGFKLLYLYIGDVFF